MSIRLKDGTIVEVDGPKNPALPLVVLLHGMGGTNLDMTAPLSQYPGIAFNRNAVFPLYRDEGFHPIPPVVPVARFFMDPPLGTVTDWRAALNAAGFTTVTYSQPSSSGPILPSIVQLDGLAREVLVDNPDFAAMRVAFVAHSRGGLTVRAFLAGLAPMPKTPAAFFRRVTSLISLHSPHTGSGLATVGATVDALAARLQAAFTAAGIAAPSFLATLRSLVLSPGIAELVPGSPLLTSIAAREPVPGIAYHTFGGTSTDFARIFAGVYTPDSTVPLPLPFPLFHWGSTPVPVGVPLNIASFVPTAVLAPLPLVQECMTVLAALAAVTPDIAPGAGDILVADSRARLPFATTHTTNHLNHLEALYDLTLQAQVLAILARQRVPVSSGTAIAQLDPFPATPKVAHSYTVSAVDSVTGAGVAVASVTVTDTLGKVALQQGNGGPFTFAFKSRTVRKLDPATHRVTTEILWPTVSATFEHPYPPGGVDTGLA